MTTILHITPHLGGGIGKALSGLVVQSMRSGSGFKHTIVCLEKPEKMDAINRIRNSGGKVICQPVEDEISGLIEKADIVQVEWWNRPSMIRLLCSPAFQHPIRLLTWCHNSGLYTPSIPDRLPPEVPEKLIRASHYFIFTSHCSLESEIIQKLIPELGDRIGVVYAHGGFEGLPEPMFRKLDNPLAVGYFGNKNVKKLHPNFITYLVAAAWKVPGFRVKMIGDVQEEDKDILIQQCADASWPDMLEFTGFVPDIASELKTINVLAYLLNPEHYGTTENALLEAMSMGIVPVVLDNPAERCLVEDGVTGMIIHSPTEFAQAIRWLSEHPQYRHVIGMQAAKSVRGKFSVERTEANLNKYYRKVLVLEKRKIVSALK